MCGIAGLLAPSLDGAGLAFTVRTMADVIAHRGPDGAGVWVDDEAGLALSHRRLAIVDLSDAGAQPMVSVEGRYVLSFNGEIYNFPELRRDLEAVGVSFRSATDTEVLLEACAAWGVEGAVARCIGMFAFALWDRTERCLHLVRDRLGLKPLYWGHFDGLFIFGSELKALRACPGWRAEIDREAFADYALTNYVPNPRTIYRNVSQLQPGMILTLPWQGTPRLRRYWDLDEVVQTALASPFTGSDREAEDALDALLRDAIGRRMVADVPLGAFLSGGVDSTSVVAIMQALSNRPINTFTIGFTETAYDESAAARAVASHLGTRHTDLKVTPEEARAVIPDLPVIYDEPFADSSQIPTCLVSRLTRGSVTVALSGDGGDEAFAGYTRYLQAPRLWSGMRLAPRPMRFATGRLMRLLSPETWDGVLRAGGVGRRQSHPGDKLIKLSRLLGARDESDLYSRLISHWQSSPVTGGGKCPSPLAGDLSSFAQQMQLEDTRRYLPDDILTKVDRASMHVGLEARAPLTDHRLVAFAWSLPMDMKIRDGQGKWLLRRVAQRYVPTTLLDRPKTGFGIPLGPWLRGPLRDWAEDLLSEPSLAADALWDVSAVRGVWHRHLAGRENHQEQLWGVLMAQAWLRHACI